MKGDSGAAQGARDPEAAHRGADHARDLLARRTPTDRPEET